MQNLLENNTAKVYQTLTDQIFYKIQSAIICGELAAGSKISEPELARVYGISRGPLREAIHRLEGQKLVERTAHVGARVVSLSHQQLHELYQIRENLEGLACRLAATPMPLDFMLRPWRCRGAGLSPAVRRQGVERLGA